MDARSYADFDLVIEQTREKYRARVISSPAGQASVEFDSLFSRLELENFVLRMGRPQRGMRRIDSTEMETIKAFGARLFQTVFNDDVYACYLRSLDEVLDQNKGLRIRLRINVPEFHDLPWEFLYNSQVDQFLALSKDTPIVRYIELPYGTQALPVRIPMKILVMISSPDGYPPLDVEGEWKKLNTALRPLIDRGLVILKRLESATLSTLQQHLRREQVHIFHYIGHGKYFEHQQDGMLLLENENHRGRATSGQHLGAILHDHRTLRLVVLNACEGARTSAEDPYTGVAQTLVRQGIPAVLAMQFEIFENAAHTLVQEFYGAIADRYPVDAALSEARKAIFARDNDVEWGTPVLFMRIPNGVLFKPPAPAEKAARLAAGQRAADKAVGQGTSREGKDRNVREQPISLLSRLYAQAENQMAQQDWSAAIDLLEQIEVIDPEFREVKDLLKQARAEKDGQEQAERWNRHEGTNRLEVQPPGSLALKTSPVAVPATEATGTESTENALDGQAVQKTAGWLARFPHAGSRRSLFVLGVVALVALSTAGYYMLGLATRPSTPAPPSTDATAFAFGAEATEPMEVPNETPSPETLSTETREPTAASNAELSVYGTANRITLYQGPDLKYGQVESYPKGENFTVLSRDSSGLWLFCKAPDGSEGWLYFEWVDVDFNLSMVPTAAFTPPPPPTAIRKPKQPKSEPPYGS